jgi:hypothetical protein
VRPGLDSIESVYALVYFAPVGLVSGALRWTVMFDGTYLSYLRMTSKSAQGIVHKRRTSLLSGQACVEQNRPS